MFTLRCIKLQQLVTPTAFCLKTTPLATITLQKQGFVSKALRDPNFKRPPPFPYKEKKYTLFQSFFDDTTHRFDENSRIIVVDGPPTGNKEKFAKELAEELDMYYMPKANLDTLFIDEFGNDTRILNPKLPPRCRTFDIHEFVQNPKHILTTQMQFNLMTLRFEQYIDAINHLLNTGQGVVMHRSIYSSAAFIETMAELGYVTKNALNYHRLCLENGMAEFLRPHLVLYLDVPPQKIIENIKERNRPEEVNSPFFTLENMKVLVKHYKENVLRDHNVHSETLIYDWTEEGTTEFIVDDICRLDLDQYTRHDKKLYDWLFQYEVDWKEIRIMFSNYRHFMTCWLDNVPNTDVPELHYTEPEERAMAEALLELPGSHYAKGFNKELRDKNILFKW